MGARWGPCPTSRPRVAFDAYAWPAPFIQKKETGTMTHILAIDQGTTSTRAILFGPDLSIVAVALVRKTYL